MSLRVGNVGYIGSRVGYMGDESELTGLRGLQE